MTVYLDSDFVCHVSPGEGLTAYETAFFDLYPPDCVRHYRCVPTGRTWTRPDGVAFRGEMIAPHKPYDLIAESMSAVDRAEKVAAEQLATLIDLIYQTDLEVIDRV